MGWVITLMIKIKKDSAARIRRRSNKSNDNIAATSSQPIAFLKIPGAFHSSPNLQKNLCPSMKPAKACRFKSGNVPPQEGIKLDHQVFNIWPVIILPPSPFLMASIAISPATAAAPATVGLAASLANCWACFSESAVS